MDVRAGGKGSPWKLCIGSAVVCGVLVFTGGFLHRNAVASAIDEQQAKSAAYVHAKLAPAVGNDKLTKELGEHAAADLKKEADVPAGAEVRIYALGGAPVFSSGHGGAGDRAAIAAAAGGDVSRVISGSDLAVYAPIENKGGKPIAVAAVVNDIDAVRAEAVGPLDAVRMPLVGLGIVLLVAGLVLMLRGRRSTPTAMAAGPATPKEPKKPAKQAEETPSKSKVSGFDPAPALAVAPQQPTGDVEPRTTPQPVEVADETGKPSRSRMSLRIGRKERSEPQPEVQRAPDTAEAKTKRSLFGRSKGGAVAPVPVAVEPGPVDEMGPAPMTPEREASIRRLLEDQLEQLRTKLQTQEEAAVSANRALQDELDAALRRAHQAEAGAAPEGQASVGPVDQDVIERARVLEAELAGAKAAAAEAVARADELQRTIDAAGPVAAADPSASDALRAQLAAAEQGLEDARRLATEAEQRAASIESVRGELEVRVAQLGAKAGELEQRATELEARLQEANAGGDAVRAEIASLTAALGASNARVEELESSASDAGADDREASAAEIARLRTELANHMERAQSAEDRVATLEADVLAAEAGVDAIVDPVVDEDDEPASQQEAPAPTVWVAPGASVSEPVVAADDNNDAAADVDNEVAADVDDEVAAEATHEPTKVPQSTSTAWVAPEASEKQSQSNGAATDPVERTPEPNGDGFSAVFAAAFPQDRPSNGSEPKTERAAEPEAPESADAVLPQAPAADDRYGDVWSDAEAQTDTPAEPGSAAPEPAEAALQASAPMASSLDESAPVVEEPSDPRSEQTVAEPSDDDSMSVEDDLWALRARLAHAADDQDEAEPAHEAPRWS